MKRALIPIFVIRLLYTLFENLSKFNVPYCVCFLKIVYIIIYIFFE